MAGWESLRGMKTQLRVVDVMNYEFISWDVTKMENLFE